MRENRVNRNSKKSNPKVVVVILCIIIALLVVSVFLFMPNILNSSEKPKTTQITFESSKETVSVSPQNYEIKITAIPNTLMSGETFQLTYTQTSAQPPKNTVWRSEDESVATVDENGLVSAHNSGKTLIWVKNEKGSHSVEVTVDSIDITHLSLNESTFDLNSGMSIPINIQIEPSNATAITYESSDPLIAYVDNKGNVTAKAKGSAEIRVFATYNKNITAICTINVIEGPLKPLSPIQPSRYTSINGVLTSSSPQNSQKATIMVTGDLLALSAQLGKAKNGDTYDFNNSFKYVKTIFEKSDFVMGNLETTIGYSFPFTQATIKPSLDPNIPPEAQVTPKILPILNAPSTYLDALRYAGYDAVATVNNHCADTGSDGINQTIDILNEYKIAYVGTNKSQQSNPFILADINGIKVAFLAYSEFFNGRDGALTSDERKSMIHKYSKERVKSDVALAKSAGAQYIIAYTHWGNENEKMANSTQKQHAQEMANSGVDFIAGSHSHCLQEAQYITADDGRNVLVLYSMGNFVSSMPQEMHNDTAIFEINLEKTNDSVALIGAGYYPCKVYSNYEGDDFVIVPVNINQNTAAKDRISVDIGGAINPLL